MPTKSITQGNGSCVPMDGKPRNRSRKWRLTVSCGKDALTGKYRRRTRVVRGTQSQAKAALRDFISELEREVPRSSMLLSDWLGIWHNRRVEDGSISKRSIASEKTCIKGLCYHLGDVPLSAIEPKAVEGMYAAMMDGNTHTGKALTGTSVRPYHRTLKTALKAAAAEGLIPSSPMEYVTPPSMDTAKREGLDAEGLAYLLKSLDPSDYRERAILVIAVTGLRRSECCALLWQDIDGQVVTVSKSTDIDLTDKAPKTEAGVRKVMLPQFASDAIEPYRERPLCPVVSPGAAEHVTPKSLTMWWGANRSRFGCDGIRLHDLRHAYVSQLARSGVPVNVAKELAGHSSSTITLDIYSHATDEDKRKAAESFSHDLHMDG